MIRVGDLVIKNTGGNKMRVISISSGIAECAWITESFNQGIFPVQDLVPLSDYKNLFKEEKRNDKIQSILDSPNYKNITENPLLELEVGTGESLT